MNTKPQNATEYLAAAVDNKRPDNAPCYLTPSGFSFSREDAIRFDDEDLALCVAIAEANRIMAKVRQLDITAGVEIA